jgi:hypothetical protein
MANIVLRNGWGDPATYKDVKFVSFATPDGSVATYYEDGNGGSGGLSV